MKKMSIKEWNEFARDCKWCVIEEVPDPEEVEKIRAANNDLDEES